MKIFLFLSFCAFLNLTGHAQTTVILNVNTIDMLNDGVQENQDILIQDGKIKYIGRVSVNDLADQSISIIDGTGKYLMPGLIDTHAHIIDSHSPHGRDIKFLQDEFNIMIANGITGIKNMKSFVRQIELAKKIENGEVIGPRIFVDTPALDSRPITHPSNKDAPPGSNYFCRSDWSNCSIFNKKGAEEYIKFAKEAGYDGIKVREPMVEDMLWAIAEEAKKYDLPIGGHISNENEYIFNKILKAKIYSSFDHSFSFYTYAESADSPFRNLPEGELVPPYFLRSLYPDQAKLDEIIDIAAKNFDGYYAPTLKVFDHLISSGREKIDVKELLGECSVYFDKCWLAAQQADFNFLYNHPNYKAYRENSKYGPKAYEEAFQNALDMTKRLHEAGVKFVTGTDFPAIATPPGFAIHDEIRLLNKAGLSNFEALKTATYNAAKLLKLEDTGMIREGAIADLVLLSGNPLEDINHTKSINTVFLRGERFSNRLLNKMLNKVKIKAKKHKNGENCSSAMASFLSLIHI